MKALYIALGGTAVALAGAGYWYFTYAKAVAASALDNAPDPGAAISDTVDTVTEAVQSTVLGWQSVHSGPQWLPSLNAAEQAHNLPHNLLAAIAYRESRFRDSIIRGEQPSSAGALGMMQLEPAYYASVNVPVPFTDVDVANQIEDAANEMTHLYSRFSDWTLAVAAYNAGEGNVHKYNGVPPFPETQAYVAEINANVPALEDA